jgi:ATP-dependent RNA helicase RhlE
MQFSDFKLNKQLLNAIEEAGFKQPSPIQEKAIPLGLAGHDVIGIAQTGTGKTAAFLLPILMKTKYAQGTAPRVIILAPTRELAIQIDAHIVPLSKYTDLRHTAVYGGKGIKSQIKIIQEGIDILVATPQRLIDIHRAGGVNLRSVQTMVLDEADRVMDMGFIPQISKILELVPHKKRQNFLFSATMPDKVLKLSEQFLDFPKLVEVSPQATTASTIEQVVYKVPNFNTKLNLLESLLKDEEVLEKVLIFTRTKGSANEIFRLLSSRWKDKIRVIHGNKDQNARINAIEAFAKGEIRILVATDVAARGLDVEMVSHVVNFDVPRLYEDYVHRIGRTGRAEREGIAITFANKVEEYHVKQIEQLIQMYIAEKSLFEAGVKIVETPFDEMQEIAKELDTIKKKLDPTFQGAFHDKKARHKPVQKKRYIKRKNNRI